ELHVYTALTLSTATSHPSIQTIQWTPDGQLCLTTKTVAYIMTPDYGINFDTSSVVRPSLSAKDKDAGSTIGWFRTIIQVDKADPMKWPEYSQEWGTLSLGSMDLTLCTVVFSPSGLSSDAGCVAATLSSNMDLCLWAPVKNSLKGEWENLFNITPFILDHLQSSEMQESDNKTPLVLKAQITSTTWSQQCDFGYEPNPLADGSLLVAGNRAGSLLFFRFSPATQGIEVINMLDVCDKWVTHISITPWKTTEQGQCESILAYGTADGSIGAVKLTQRFSQSTSSSELFKSSKYEINLIAEQLSSRIHEPDHSGITALQWVGISDRDPILVHCTPGLVHLHYSTSSPQTPTSNWHKHSLRLKTHRGSTASSALHPPSGITYLPIHDELLITLSDGSINVLQGLCTGHPHLVDDDGRSSLLEGEVVQDQRTPSKLSTNARSIFTRSERGEVDKHDLNKITGMTGYDPNDGVFVWSYEVHRPGDFSYKHDAKQKSVLVVASLWNSSSAEDIVLLELERVLGRVKASSGWAPLDTLRPILFSMSIGKRLNMIHGKVLEVLNRGVTVPNDMKVDIGPELDTWKGKGRANVLETNIKEGFRKSISKHLFGWDAVTAWRVKLGLADYVWKLSDSPEKKAACGAIAQSLLNVITHHLYTMLVKHMLIVSAFLTPSDVPFAHRLSVIVQTSPDGVRSPDLITDAQRLLDSVGNVPVEEGALKELCPACHVEVPLADVRAAICLNGHVWTRCSVTTFILSTASVRTCIGCKRKAFLPPSAMNGREEERVQHLPPPARGSIALELLEAAQRCLFCGNKFVCIV
ncbi:putative zinc-finger of transcription factor IIIC complex-domain-containing protein, partial [Amanita rubescens]